MEGPINALKFGEEMTWEKITEILMAGERRAECRRTTRETDTTLAFGDCLHRALGDELGISRYGYCLPMDDCLCRVALDFGGRPWLQWDVSFRAEMTGSVPSDMWEHFFKSLSDAAQMNLSVSARGRNAHHKIEGIFKAFARALRVAVQRDVRHLVLPSSKGTL